MMTTANLNHGVPRLTEGQAKALALKMEAFWSELSPAEHSQVNRALSRMGDDSADVSGHASMAEWGYLVAFIAALL